MQLPTHLLLGILIQLLLQFTAFEVPLWIQFGTIALCAIISHVLLDCIAVSTYHPANAQWNDIFWKIYHIFVYIMAILIIILWGVEYWWGMIWSFLIDLYDWIFLRKILKKEPQIHPIIDRIRDRFFSWLPNLKEKKSGIFGEMILNLGFLILILLNT